MIAKWFFVNEKLNKVKFDKDQENHIEFEQIKTERKITANLDTFINNVNHLSNFLNSWKTWINIKDMYILTYIPQC